MHKEEDVHVDDMFLKSKNKARHILSFQKFFAKLKQYNMPLNPQKCEFWVTSEKLLEYVVSLGQL